MEKNFVTEVIGYIFSPNSPSDWTQSTTTIVIQLAAGDDVWVDFINSHEIVGGRYGTYDDFVSHFSGFFNRRTVTKQTNKVMLV
ncbi:hypothetical protein DPMN_048601 [Dreissena polymorpha]|uniref:C1q domain-containing protein n=1 Tax=Dreissena polymorpha TaxID=45954 RepID=A0A9D4D9W0_DREPO|nr:hypothetical protein DPMN_048601 [Dreissena polymorpha]